jgi:hypothetical protein
MNTTIKASKIILLLLLPSVAHVNNINTIVEVMIELFMRRGENIFSKQGKRVQQGSIGI